MAAVERADLLAQIGTAQAELDQLLSQLGNHAGTTLAEAQAQRQLLAQIERSLASGLTMPASVRSEVASVIASTSQLGQQVRAASEYRGSLDLATAQARTRATVLEMSRDIYERRIFDPYLRFASAEEADAYRRREEENRRAIAEALAENTPEGDLRAARIMERQLQDAGAHGADASPEYQAMAARSRQSVDQLSRAIGDRAPEAGADTPAQNAQPPSSPAPASDEQLASILATFRAIGICGGLHTSDCGHGLSVNASSRDQGRATPA